MNEPEKYQPFDLWNPGFSRIKQRIHDSIKSCFYYSTLAILSLFLVFGNRASSPLQTGLTANMFNMIQKCKICQRDL